MRLEGVEVIDRDENLWVLNKPSGLLSAPGRGPDKQDCLLGRVQAHDPSARLVHRLDQATSGLMLLARGLEVQRRLNRAFAERRVQKIYLAEVDGCMDDGGQWQMIDAPIDLHWPDRPRHHVGPDGKPSQTGWRVLATDPTRSRTCLALRPITGRSHQLRVHLSWLGHPICGDTLYAPPQVAQGAPRLLLHAWQLALPDPISSQNRVWQAPLPPEWALGFCQQTVAQGLHNALTTPPTGDVYA
jgi:tRNA pseudouridine32 synthase/23S rRNA pseudouridine746 synthase